MKQIILLVLMLVEMVRCSAGNEHELPAAYRVKLMELVHAYGVAMADNPHGIYDFQMMDMSGDENPELFVSYVPDDERSGFLIYEMVGDQCQLLFQEEKFYFPDATGPILKIHQTESLGYITGRNIPDTYHYLVGYQYDQLVCISDIELNEMELENKPPDTMSMMENSVILLEVYMERLVDRREVELKELSFEVNKDKQTFLQNLAGRNRI